MGSSEVENYQQRRQEAVKKSELEGSPFHWGCFHDGNTRFEEVKNTHEKILRQGQLDQKDPTTWISQLILEHMLQADYNKRLDAHRLHQDSRLLLCGQGDHMGRQMQDNIYPQRQHDNRNTWEFGHHDSSQNSNVQDWFYGGRNQDHAVSNQDDLLRSFRNQSTSYDAEQGRSSDWRQSQTIQPHQSNTVSTSATQRNKLTVETLYNLLQHKDKLKWKRIFYRSFDTLLVTYPTLKEAFANVKGVHGGRDQVSGP